MNFSFENLNDSGTCVGSLASRQNKSCRVSSVILVLALLLSFGGGKNGLRRLRLGSSYLLRPKDAQGSRPALRGPADLSGRGDPPCLFFFFFFGVPKRRKRSTGAECGRRLEYVHILRRVVKTAKNIPASPIPKGRMPGYLIPRIIGARRALTAGFRKA